MGKELFKLGVSNGKCDECISNLNYCNKLIFKSKTLCLKLKKNKCKKKRTVHIELPVPDHSNSVQLSRPAQFHNNGVPEPAPITPGQPFTFSINDIPSSGVVFTTGVFNPPFSSSGTVFRLVNKGIYQVSFQTSYTEDAGVLLYLGNTIQALAPLSYTSTGKLVGTQVVGSFLVNVPNNNSYLALVASPNNVNNIFILQNSSSNNLSSTSISIVQLTHC